MNSLERIINTISFKPADRVPVIAQIFGGAATLASIPVDQYVRDGNCLAECQLAALERYRHDAVFTVMDVNVENEAVGSKLECRPNQYPTVAHHVLSKESDWSALTIPDPLKAGRMPEMLKALNILRRELKDKVLIVGCILGPFTLATQLLGMEKALYLAIDDCPRLEQLMDFASEVIIRFGVSQIEAGAHLPIVFDPSASPAVVPPQFFRELELPRLKKVFQSLKEAGALANWLHIAGPVQTILPYYPQVGVSIANFDYCVSPDEVQNHLPVTCVNGNIRPLAFVDSTPGEIEDQARSLLTAFRRRGGFILSSGCEIPPEAASNNIISMISAVEGAT
jgi:uroporphyrinogen decarboxylase